MTAVTCATPSRSGVFGNLLWKLGPVTWTLGGVADQVPFQPVVKVWLPGKTAA